jgi:hypothetical protein
MSTPKIDEFFVYLSAPFGPAPFYGHPKEVAGQEIVIIIISAVPKPQAKGNPPKRVGVIRDSGGRGQGASPCKPGPGARDLLPPNRVLHVRNSASGPEIKLPGRILAGLLVPGQNRNRPSGRPSAGRRPNFGAFPVAVLPNFDTEAQFLARKHYYVIWSTLSLEV